MISSIFYIGLYKESAYQQFESVSLQSLGTVVSTISDKLDQLNVYSKVILSNQNVQAYLKTKDTYPRLVLQKSVDRYMKEFIAYFPDVDAITLMDLKGDFISHDRIKDSSVTGIVKIKFDMDARWYRDVYKRRGGSIFRFNGDDLYTRGPQMQVITLMRLINNLDTQIPIGALAVNMESKVLARAYSALDISKESAIILLDENDQLLVQTDIETELIDILLLRLKATGKPSLQTHIDGKQIHVAYQVMKDTGWQLLSITQIRADSLLNKNILIMVIGVMLLNGFVILVGAITIARSITQPVSLMARAMSFSHQGQLQKAAFKSRIPEISGLRDDYNAMVDGTSNLMKRIVEEEQFKRRAELSALQAQIKPHFLYNTFYSISALALMGEHEKIYTLMGALGTFYRLSLSGGDEFITLKEELEIVTHYMAIQRIRYDDIFEFKVIQEGDHQSLRIPKLTLQPLVENALYHGIKPLGRKGKIEIHVLQQKDSVVLTVEDDGLGMTEAELLRVSGMASGKSFGIRGTRERLKLFYGQDVMTVNSTANYGTMIVLTLPNTQGGESYDPKG
jgi:two-component system sensor histidine kinase YesM